MERISDSDSDPNQTAETLNTAAPSRSAAFSLLCFAGNSAFGALVGSIFGYGNGLIKKKGFKGSFVEARSSAKRFAVSSGVDNLVLYQLNILRGKDDGMLCYYVLSISRRTHCISFAFSFNFSFAFTVINAGVAGCCTGLALSFPGTFTISSRL
nr:mitochondrial import inner membrane translocase subunit TIM22-2-like [Ipomoea batatas]